MLVGQARAELAIAPRVGERSLGPLLTNLDTANARSRSLSESFAAVAVADGLSLPLAALCAEVAGVPLSEERRAAVALARHQVEALSQALAAFRLEPAHGTVEALISSLNADSPGKSRGKGKDRDELRQSLTLAGQRLAERVGRRSEVHRRRRDLATQAQGGAATLHETRAEGLYRRKHDPPGRDLEGGTRGGHRRAQAAAKPDRCLIRTLPPPRKCAVFSCHKCAVAIYSTEAGPTGSRQGAAGGASPR